MSVYTVYNSNYGCYFISPIAITQRSGINSGKRPFLVQELRFLIAQARCVADVHICYFVDAAEEALHEILVRYYENPELHKYWIHFYGYQREYLTLYTPENHQIADDIYDCFNNPLLHQPGKYIKSYNIPKLLEEEEEVHTEPEVAPSEIDIPPPLASPPSEIIPEVIPEVKKQAFDWMKFKANLDAITEQHPKEERGFQPQPIAPRPSRHYRGRRRNGYGRKY